MELEYSNNQHKNYQFVTDSHWYNVPLFVKYNNHIKYKISNENESYQLQSYFMPLIKIPNYSHGLSELESYNIMELHRYNHYNYVFWDDTPAIDNVAGFTEENKEQWMSKVYRFSAKGARALGAYVDDSVTWETIDTWVQESMVDQDYELWRPTNITNNDASVNFQQHFDYFKISTRDDYDEEKENTHGVCNGVNFNYRNNSAFVNAVHWPDSWDKTSMLQNMVYQLPNVPTTKHFQIISPPNPVMLDHQDFAGSEIIYFIGIPQPNPNGRKIFRTVTNQKFNKLLYFHNLVSNQVMSASLDMYETIEKLKKWANFDEDVSITNTILFHGQLIHLPHNQIHLVTTKLSGVSAFGINKCNCLYNDLTIGTSMAQTFLLDGAQADTTCSYIVNACFDFCENKVQTFEDYNQLNNTMKYQYQYMMCFNIITIALKIFNVPVWRHFGNDFVQFKNNQIRNENNNKNNNSKWYEIILKHYITIFENIENDSKIAKIKNNFLYQYCEFELLRKQSSNINWHKQFDTVNKLIKNQDWCELYAIFQECQCLSYFTNAKTDLQKFFDVDIPLYLAALSLTRRELEWIDNGDGNPQIIETAVDETEWLKFEQSYYKNN